MSRARLNVVRALAVFVVAWGISYLYWRWSATVAWEAWWIAIPLVLAETYSLSESVLYAITMWNSRHRPKPLEAPEGKTVDVFIATYNESLEIVLKTAVAARNIRYPHKTWILDDGDRPEFAEAARRIGVGYITRGPEWEGRPRFAKAGNVNNALFKTSAEFIAIFDADQVPDEEFLDRVLGYFEDLEVAFVQTPQQFWNVPGSDPLGSQAELFYGPIQQGKDGWGAAFFCGSNAVLRREALMALGVTRFSRTAFERVRKELRAGRRQLRRNVDHAAPGDVSTRRFGVRMLGVLAEAEAAVRRGETLSDVTLELRQAVQHALQRRTVSEELLETLRHILERVEVARTNHALALDPIDTGSITEDMATAMHLHALGWASVYHHEVLVHGLAPEDIHTMLSQRGRWAAGTMQVFFTDNPLFVKGLTIGQRLMYLSTMTSYLNGLAAVVYIAAPIVFLSTGTYPIHADSRAFFFYFIPSFIFCQALFIVAGNRSRGLWRGQQMSFALFPTWIKATLSGASAAFLGRTLTFSVTSKTKQASGSGLRHVIPQLIAIGALLAAAVWGGIQAVAGNRPQFATALTLFWVAMDVALLWSTVRAARYRGPGDDIECPLSPDVVQEAEHVIADIRYESWGKSLASGRNNYVVPKADSPSTVAPSVFRSVQPSARVHRAVGRFDAIAALELRSDVAQVAALWGQIILVDVSLVTTVTPSGAAAMLELLRMVRARGGDLRMFGESRGFASAREAMSLSHLTRLYSGRDEASRTRAA
jgi:cellulose synthase (UDP-forming)